MWNMSTIVCILVWQWGPPLYFAWREYNGAFNPGEGRFLPLLAPVQNPDVHLAPITAYVLAGEWVSPPLSFAPVSDEP